MSRHTIAKLYCYQCQHGFPLNMTMPITEIRCPYCNEKVDSDMVEKIRDAFGVVHDLNLDFADNHVTSDQPQFSLDVISDEIHLPLDDIDD